jgi:hypothetical protein
MAEPISDERLARFRRDAKVTREHVPTGYHVAHRTADAVDVLADELERLMCETPALPADLTVVELRAGDRVALVTSHYLTLDVQDAMKQKLERVAPGLVAVVIDGIDTVVVQRGPAADEPEEGSHG